MKRPILVAVIGYIIGIISGLYFNISIVSFYIFIAVICFSSRFLKKLNKCKRKVKKFNFLSIRRYFKYSKIFLNSRVIILLVVSSIVSNSIVIYKNKEYKEIYDKLESIEVLKFNGVVIENKEEKQYYNKYKVKVKIGDNKKINLYLMADKNVNLDYGDKVIFEGTYIRPEVQRNYKGFDYSEYLKQLNVYGKVKCTEIELLEKRQDNRIFQISSEIKTNIIEKVNYIFDRERSAILLGLILGDKTGIEENIQENFRNAGISHILAISGMHVAYVILGISSIFKNILGKRKTNMLIILVLIVYMFITNFSPSVTRAGIMGILMIFSKIIYRKNDTITSMSISMLVILIYNPFLIKNLGFQLSYGGVIGIILFNKNVLNILKNIKIKNKFYKYKIKPQIEKILNKIKEIISISISVQLIILPILLKSMNTFNLYFLISNLFISFLIGPVVISAFLFIIIILINFKLGIFLSKFLLIGIQLVINVSNIGLLPHAKIYVATINLFHFLIYYIFIISLFFLYDVYSSKNPNKTQIRIRNLIALFKMKIRDLKHLIKKIVLVLFTFIFIVKIIPNNLKIYFIDVGQGDSCLIVTPENKTILIDGGGSDTSDFDIGKNTLLPYILDRGFTKIDFMIVSHFDSDHVRTDYLQY